MFAIAHDRMSRSIRTVPSCENSMANKCSYSRKRRIASTSNTAKSKAFGQSCSSGFWRYWKFSVQGSRGRATRPRQEPLPVCRPAPGLRPEHEKAIAHGAWPFGTAILEAREPAKLLFSDLPLACGFDPIEAGSGRQAYQEFRQDAKARPRRTENRFPGSARSIAQEIAGDF